MCVRGSEQAPDALFICTCTPTAKMLHKPTQLLRPCQQSWYKAVQAGKPVHNRHFKNKGHWRKPSQPSPPQTKNHRKCQWEGTATRATASSGYKLPFPQLQTLPQRSTTMRTHPLQAYALGHTEAAYTHSSSCTAVVLPSCCRVNKQRAMHTTCEEHSAKARCTCRADVTLAIASAVTHLATSEPTTLSCTHWHHVSYILMAPSWCALCCGHSCRAACFLT
jgi:hypothetical protein